MQSRNPRLPEFRRDQVIQTLLVNSFNGFPAGSEGYRLQGRWTG